VVVLLCHGLVCADSGRADSGRADPRPLRLGALLHLTGEHAPTGQAFREGLELGMETVNREGRIPGKRLEIIFEDTRYLPLTASTAAMKLARQDEVLATFITTITETKSAAAELRSQRVPTLVLWDSSPQIEALGEYFFGIGPWAPASGERSAEFAWHELGARSAVVLNSNTEWSLHVTECFIRRFEALGGKVMLSEASNPDETDYRPLLQRAKARAADVWYVPIDGNIPPFFRQARNLGVSTPLITSDIITDELITAGDGAFEGIYQTMTADLDTPPVRALLAAYESRYGRPVTQAPFVAWGYDAVLLVAHAIRSGGTEREQIKDALHRVRNFPGVSGVITMNGRGSAPREIQVRQLRGGVFRTVAAPARP